MHVKVNYKANLQKTTVSVAIVFAVTGELPPGKLLPGELPPNKLPPGRLPPG